MPTRSNVTADNLPILDLETALERIENDRELYLQIVQIYITDAPKQLGGIYQALGTLDRKVIERHAHSLKSASANVGAERARWAASALEDQAPSAEIIEVERLAQLLKAEIASALGALENYLSQ